MLVLEGEHPNHAYRWLALVADDLEVRRVPTTDPANAGTFAPYINDRTICIGVSSVMFHSGQLNNMKDICNRFRPRGIHILADITQHIGSIIALHNAMLIQHAIYANRSVRYLFEPSRRGGRYETP